MAVLARGGAGGCIILSTKINTKHYLKSIGESGSSLYVAIYERLTLWKFLLFLSMLSFVFCFVLVLVF